SVLAAWDRDDNAEAAIDHLPGSLAERLTAGLLGDGAMAAGDCLQVAHDCVARIQRRNRRSQAAEVRAKLRAAEESGDEEGYRQQLHRHGELLRRRDGENA